MNDPVDGVALRFEHVVEAVLDPLAIAVEQLAVHVDGLVERVAPRLVQEAHVEGKRDIQTKVMTTLFALFAEVERDLISERTREGLAKARASGRELGRPKGLLGVSRLDGKEDEIRHPSGWACPRPRSPRSPASPARPSTAS